MTSSALARRLHRGARGAEQQSHGVDNVLAYINVLLAMGHAGRVSSGYGCLTGQGNGQGGREHGQKADQLPGYRKIDNPARGRPEGFAQQAMAQIFRGHQHPVGTPIHDLFPKRKRTA